MQRERAGDREIWRAKKWKKIQMIDWAVQEQEINQESDFNLIRFKIFVLLINWIW